MLKKSITYKDYDENSVTEDFWFHLTKAELAELMISKGEGFDAYLTKIAATNDMSKILPIFKEIIAMTVGRRDEETRRFIKNATITEEFMASEAYSELFMEFMTDANAFVTFIKGVMPKELVEELDFTSNQLKAPAGTKKVQVIELPSKPKEEARPFEDYSHEELMEMSQQDFDKLTTGDPRKMTKGMLEKAYLRQTRPNIQKDE